MEKKITASQKLGIDAEHYIRYFASSELNLLAEKLTNDFGIDFICQIIGKEISPGIKKIPPKFVAFFVRSTLNKKNPYAEINKADAKLFLTCDFPFILVLLYKHPKKDYCVAFRFQTDGFIKEIINFINSDRETKRISFKNCISDINIIKNEISRMKEPEYLDNIKMNIRKYYLQYAIPESRLQIIQNPDQTYSIIQLANWEDQYNTHLPKVEEVIMKAAFGKPALISRRLQKLPLKDDLLTAFEYLPTKVLITAPSFETGKIVKLTSNNGEKEVGCDFMYRRTKTHFGYYHQSGLALVISNRELHDGEYVHTTRSQIDEKADTPILKYPKLCAFLENCIGESKIQFGVEKYTLPTDSFNLQAYGWLVKYLKDLKHFECLNPSLWELKDSCEEDLQSLRILSQLNKNISLFNGWGFVLDKISDKNIGEEFRKFSLPLCMNIRGGGYIYWLEVEGVLFRNLISGDFCGIKIEKVRNSDLEERNQKFPFNTSPRFKICANWPSICIYPSGNKHLNYNEGDWNINLKWVT
ncbi:hypothetical protein KAU32_09825 [bacterium]|nr:hypothetical protein [bacterium]